MGKNEGDGKRLRAARAQQQRSLRKTVARLFVAFSFMTEREVFDRWIVSTNGFTGLLRFFGSETFGTSEDVSADWERRLCEIITDVAERELSAKEWQKADLSTPQHLCCWFADFLDDLFPKADLAWTSKIFFKENLLPLLDEVEAVASKRMDHHLNPPDLLS